MWVRTSLLAVMLAMPVVSNAAGLSGPRTIVNMGCHVADDGCYAFIDGAPVGPPACAGNSIRWSSQDSAGGSNILGLISAAYFRGKKVDFWVSSSCWAADNAHPTFDWITVVNP